MKLFAILAASALVSGIHLKNEDNDYDKEPFLDEDWI